MSLRPESLQVGDKLYNVETQQAGNTTMTRKAIFRVEIVELKYRDDGVLYGASVKWNGNKPSFWGTDSLKKLYRFHPKPTRSIWDNNNKAWDAHVARCAKIAEDEKAAFKAAGRKR